MCMYAVIVKSTILESEGLYLWAKSWMVILIIKGMIILFGFAGITLFLPTPFKHMPSRLYFDW
ncbi:hypothetical protein A9Q97_06875 [Rhodospirillales bacterium 47_12_T64]|nr:hypothetical protein A9Q97_06875 [Rhodospirillales bacterium 47_12_T64]